MFPANYEWQSNIAKQLCGLMNVSDPLGALKRLIEASLQSQDLDSIPVNLEVVASYVSIKKIIPVTMDGDARLIEDNGQTFIQVNALHNKPRQRFSIAHEITHKILKDKLHKNSHIVTRRGIEYFIEDRETERLCNWGAHVILKLSNTNFIPIIDANGYSIATILQISNDFDVSVEAAARAFVENATKDLAVAFFLLGLRKAEISKSFQPSLFPDLFEPPLPMLRFRRFYYSPTFPRIMRKNKSIPETSCIYRAFQTATLLGNNETIQFDQRNICRVEIEASPIVLYDDGLSHQSVMALFSNPVLQAPS